MTQEARFFDSQSGDRIYGASDWADIFKAFVRNGYVADIEEQLQVSNAVGDRDLRVGLGSAWVEGRNFEIHTSAETITLTAAGTNERWDRVVVRLDTEERNVYLAVIEGAEGGGRPALTRSSTRYEISLAAIRRPGGSTVIQDSDINDERNDEELCGVAQGHDVVVRSEPMTTAERDALSGSDLYVGRLILNTDESPTELQWWNGSTWERAFEDPHDHDLTYVNLAGDTMEGSFTLFEDPDLDMKAATKRYVDSGVSDSMAVTGTYTGNGAADRTISLGFTPSHVQILPDSGANDRWWWMTGVGIASAMPYSFIRETGVRIETGGFLVGGSGSSSGLHDKANGDGAVYHYVAHR